MLAVMIVVAVLTLLVASALVYTGREAGSANQFKRRETMSACSRGARNFVMSQIRVGALGRQNAEQFAGEVLVGDLRIRTGHLDLPAASPPARAITPCPGGGPTSMMTDLTNSSTGPGGSMGRQCYQIVAHCINTATTDRVEVEFQVTVAL